MTTRGDKPDIAIVGAGLVGSLLALVLMRRGLTVAVYERQGDIRGSSQTAGRSINLVLTARGIRALAKVGLERGAMDLTVPVRGRMMHDPDGELTYQPYGKDESECNYSISRRRLNQFLIAAAEAQGASFHFEQPLLDADLERRRLIFEQGSVEAPLVLGADGAGSALRTALMRREGFEESVEFLDHDYKELLIPVAQGATLERNALHIWPRGRLMLMALPNLNGSFTVTLYLPRRGPDGFEELDTPASVEALFRTQFPDAIPLIPDLAESFVANPTGTLGTVRCAPWHYGDRAALVGDAAHAIVPFFGQGMNCGFEDCSVLDELLDAHGCDWTKVLSEFDRLRKPDADAIAEMALENFVEMRDHLADARFLLRKQVEHRLEREWPQEYRSRYSMVMYSQIPYRIALEAGRIHDEILAELCDGLQSAAELDLPKAKRLIRSKLTPLLKRHAVELTY